MSKYYGNILEDATIELTFNTFNSDGASVTVTNLADADIKVHKDGSTTEIATDGATVAIDFDGITGNHMITIDTSVDAAYATGSNYEVRVEGITVDTQTINAFIGSFSIENRFMRGTDSAATEAKQDIIDTNVDTLIDNQFPDEVFVPASGTIRLNKKGTVTQLSIKDLKDPAGAAVDSTEDIIAEATEQ